MSTDSRKRVADDFEEIRKRMNPDVFLAPVGKAKGTTPEYPSAESLGINRGNVVAVDFFSRLESVSWSTLTNNATARAIKEHPAYKELMRWLRPVADPSFDGEDDEDAGA